MKTVFGSGAIVAAVLIAAPAQSHAQILVNGDFQTGSLSPWVKSGAVQIVTISPGNFGAQMGAGTTLAQSITGLTLGLGYTVSFSVRRDGVAPGFGYSFTASAGSGSQAFVGAASGAGYPPVTYSGSFQFFASSASESLSFAAGSYPGSYPGWVLDNVSVTQVPGPLPLLGAAAAFAWTRKLRRRIKDSAGTPVVA